MAGLGVFIDGAYLDKVCQQDFGGCCVDFTKLISELTVEIPLFRAYYCDALPYQSNPPSDGERQRVSSKQKFFDYLQRLPRFEVRLGQCVRREGADGIVQYTQKGVDVHLAVDIVRLALKNRVSDIALVTADADLIPAVQVARDEGVIVHLYHGTTCPLSLLESCDEHTRLDTLFMRRVERQR
jgi:uncharacterized LabA/DUF88 family protein